MINWILVKRKISDLKEHPKNPRTLSKDQAKHLKTSLDKFGLADKPIINQDGTIIGGHQRIKILSDMGYNEVECWYPDAFLTDEEADELNLHLNHTHGDFDYDMLANFWDEDMLYECGFTQAELGMSTTEEIEEKKPKKKKAKTCPECGHEF